VRSGCVGLELDPTLKIRDTSSSFCETFSSQVNDADLFVCICEPRVVYLRVSFSIVLLQIESYISLKKGGVYPVSHGVRNMWKAGWGVGLVWLLPVTLFCIVLSLVSYKAKVEM